MRVRVRGVVELVGPYGVGKVLGVVARLVVVVRGVLVCDGGDGAHVRAQHLQQVDLLLALDCA